MPLDAQEIGRLRRIIAISEKLIASNQEFKRDSARNGTSKIIKKRTRRTGKELLVFRRKLKAELKKGLSVAEIAKKHSVSTAYIYQL